MRDYQTKQNKDALPDSINAERFGSGEFNSIAVELEGAVSSSDQTLAPADGAGEVATQLSMALAIYGAGGAGYHKDTGAVNAYVLNPVSPKKSPPAYFDGFTVEFEPGNDNTGAATVNVASIGVVAVVDLTGTALTGGEISGAVAIRYSAAFSKFVLIVGASVSPETLVRGDISGLILSNAADTAHDITVSIGVAKDSLNAESIDITSALTKQIDAAWAVGDNAGGMFTGSVAADTWYPVYIIKKDSNGVGDIGIGDIGSIPAGYTAYRRVGWVLTDGSANILDFTDSEIAGGSVEREWAARIVDKNGTGGGAVRQTTVVSSPINEIVRLIFNVISTITCRSWIASTNFTDIIPADDISDCRNASGATHQHAEKEIQVDSSSQIAYRFDATPDTALYITTLGYTDRRVS